MADLTIQKKFKTTSQITLGITVLKQWDSPRQNNNNNNNLKTNFIKTIKKKKTLTILLMYMEKIIKVEYLKEKEFHSKNQQKN